MGMPKNEVRMEILYERRPSPIGPLTVALTPRGVCRLAFANEPLTAIMASLKKAFPRATIREEAGAAEAVFSQLEEYFAGRRKTFELPLDLHGTPFQLAVWSALQRIPYGTTCSYGAVARSIGRPGAARAVGGAIGRNPVGIIIPCHRVIDARGNLGGFGGGLETKRRLLAFEGLAPETL
ncbi:MAG: methylated-DNA-[protein]-cysteine S-methyltransferase [Clostridia bacterium]|nr:methylated-DNA-[protein]-cysteine S-methyltransferase [Clostridia bacterium]